MSQRLYRGEIEIDYNKAPILEAERRWVIRGNTVKPKYYGEECMICGTASRGMQIYPILIRICSKHTAELIECIRGYYPEDYHNFYKGKNVGSYCEYGSHGSKIPMLLNMYNLWVCRKCIQRVGYYVRAHKEERKSWK